jgi:hypothetical protein
MAVKRQLVGVLRAKPLEHWRECGNLARLIVRRNEKFASVPLEIFLNSLRVLRAAVMSDSHHPAAIEKLDALLQLIQIPFPGRAAHRPNVVHKIAPRRSGGP